jgi:hypothetical protein
MILPFSQKFPDGEQTYFAEKIIACLFIQRGKERFPFSECKISNWHFLDSCVQQGNVKKHTIREDLKNRWKAGNKIHAVYNNRSKNQFQFAPTFKCTGVQIIEIIYRYEKGIAYPLVMIDDRLLTSRAELVNLSLSDGFEGIREFFAWFNKDFKGKIIHWTDLRY